MLSFIAKINTSAINRCWARAKIDGIITDNLSLIYEINKIWSDRLKNFTLEGESRVSEQPNSPALTLWQEKLAYLQKEEAIATDAPVKFQLQKQIEECKQKISELGGQITLNPKVPRQPANQVNKQLTGSEVAELTDAVLNVYPNEVLNAFLDHFRDEEDLEVDLYTKINKCLRKINYILAAKTIKNFFDIIKKTFTVFISIDFNPFIFDESP